MSIVSCNRKKVLCPPRSNITYLLHFYLNSRSNNPINDYIEILTDRSSLYKYTITNFLILAHTPNQFVFVKCISFSIVLCENNVVEDTHRNFQHDFINNRIGF